MDWEWEWHGSDRGDLLMDRGLIMSVGKEDYESLSRLRAVRVIDEIDVRGLWVTPGIVDGHSHGQLDCVTCMMTFNAQCLLIRVAGLDGSDSEVNNIHPYLRVLDSFDMQNREPNLIIAGGVTSSLILSGSAVGIGGQAFVAKFRPTTSNSASSRLVEAPFDYRPGGKTTSKRISQHWRHMKHAVGQNPDTPDTVFNIERMDNIWDLRKAYKMSQDWKKKQDAWCLPLKTARPGSRPSPRI